jgi:putative molybdopterin biosynthesis protein
MDWVGRVDSLLTQSSQFVQLALKKMANAHQTGEASIANQMGDLQMHNTPTEPRRRLTITPQEAAAELNISRSQLYIMLRRGELPSLKIGRRRVIIWDDLVAYVKSLRAKQRHHGK